MRTEANRSEQDEKKNPPNFRVKSLFWLKSQFDLMAYSDNKSVFDSVMKNF